MAETWLPDHEVKDPVPGGAYDRLREQLDRAEGLLWQIRNGKHSLPGALVQIDRYFEQRGSAPHG